MIIDTHLGCPMVYLSREEYNQASDKENYLPMYCPYGYYYILFTNNNIYLTYSMIGINRYRIDKIRGKDLNSAYRRIWSYNNYKYVSPLNNNAGVFTGWLENEKKQTHDFRKATFYPDINSFPDN